MNFLVDFLPIVVFYVTYKFVNLYFATGVAIAMTVVMLAWMKLTGRRIEPMRWASLVIIVVFGGATLLFQDETFIKWKPTVLYGLFVILLVGARLRGSNALAGMMRNQLTLPDAVWNRLSAMWVGFFCLMAALNLVIAYRFDTETWVNFKLSGNGPHGFNVLLQAVYVNRHLQQGTVGADEPSIPKVADASNP
ncbi:MAG: septation protein A [Betaproteobacteria bacterium]|nr:septation protein A [Betaproteobacteria bacterium]